MREFIAAMREFRRPLVLLAAAILVLQTLVAGLDSAAAAQMAAGGPDAGIICHGNGDPAQPNPGPAAHDCCVFCTSTGPAALAGMMQVLDRLDGSPAATAALTGSPDIPLLPRAIRAGLSQAPPAVA